ncbi:MAG: nucleoside 2-deoxyribosyltransferase domain-containing protein [Prochloraceae cyanobacterium]|nr:nucleoside 2-deoxyribosyltransferase domain-containing protein [Prochloraceae cyanobacterium]
MKYVEAPNKFLGNEKSLFLAGGITGCPDWQQDVVKALKDESITILNPRRKNFPIDESTASFEQIEWEYLHLRKASAILFWFPHESLCPIVLYELGAWSMTDKPIFIGVDPEYQRKLDVEIQTSLVRPEVSICYSIQYLVEQVLHWLHL